MQLGEYGEYAEVFQKTTTSLFPLEVATKIYFSEQFSKLHFMAWIFLNGYFNISRKQI